MYKAASCHMEGCPAAGPTQQYSAVLATSRFYIYMYKATSCHMEVCPAAGLTQQNEQFS
jgi:hypothetical protein